MKITAIMPISPRAGASTLGANIAAYWALEHRNAGFLDLSDTAVNWQGIPEGMDVLSAYSLKSYIDRGDAEGLADQFAGQFHLKNVIVTLPYAKPAYLWPLLQLDADLVLLARLETSFAHSMEEFLGMLEIAREELGACGRIAGLLLKLATQGPRTDELLADCARIFGQTLVYSPVPHVPELGESDPTLLATRPRIDPVAPLIRDIALRILAVSRETTPRPDFPSLIRLANRLGGHLPGWIGRADAEGLEVTETRRSEGTPNEIIDELAGEIELLQKELAEARLVQKSLQDQVDAFEASQKTQPASGPDSSALDSLKAEIARLQEKLASAADDAERVAQDRNLLQTELESLQSRSLQIDDLRSALQAQIDAREAREAELGAQLEAARQDAENLRDVNDRLASELRDTQNHLHGFQAERDHTEQQIQKLRHEMGEMQQAAASSPPSGDLERLSGEVEDLRTKLAATENHLHGFQAERDSLENQLVAARRRVSELERPPATEMPVEIEIETETTPAIEPEAIETRDRQIERLQRQIGELEARLEKAEKARSVFARERAELVEKLELFREQSAEAAASMDSIVASQSELIETIQSDRSRVQTELDIRGHLYDSLRMQLLPLRQALEAGIAELPAVRRRAEAAEQRVTDLDEQCRALRAELEQARGQADDSQINALRREIDAARTQLEDAESRAAELEARLRDEFGRRESDLKESRAALEREIDRVRSESELAAIRANTAEKALETKSRELAHQQAQASAVREQLQRLEPELASARAELDRLQVQSREMETVRNDLEQARIQLSAARTMTEEATTARHSLENRIRELERQLGDAQGPDGQRTSRYESLLRELADAREELATLKSRLSRASMAEKFATERAARIIELEAELETLRQKLEPPAS